MEIRCSICGKTEYSAVNITNYVCASCTKKYVENETSAFFKELEAGFHDF